MNIRFRIIGYTDRRSDYLRACGEALAHQQRARFERLKHRLELPRFAPLGRGPLEIGRLGAPHPTPCGCHECLSWWTQEDSDEGFINAASAA